jgi:peptidoglycan-binding protein ArfA
VSSRPEQSAAVVLPATSPPAAAAASPAAPLGAMSIVRSGNGFTLMGQMPDATSKASLLEALRQALPGAKIVDELTVAPGVSSPEFAGLGGLFGAALETPGFSANLRGGIVTLTGTASSAATRAAASAAAKATWPNASVVNDIGLTTGTCSTLQADVSALLKEPITFDTDGFTLEWDSQKLLGQVAAKLEACPGAKVAVVGYTDDTGDDASNVTLSASRASSVATALVSDGVPRAVVTSRGAGASNPVAANDTLAGRAQNRRVEIIVS